MRTISAAVLVTAALTPLAHQPSEVAHTPSATVLSTLAPSTQFDITGLLQTATLDTPDDVHSGGTLVINGHHVVIPRETVVTLPANSLTWQELFTHAPAPYGPTQTGMALNDTPKPLSTYEVRVEGNRVIDTSGDRYVAGLVHISQETANTGVGYISFIDYATGELEVGGSPGVAGTGARVAINDPANPTALDETGTAKSGRFGRPMTPDDRFQADQDNPTITAETGFPMCIPRVTADPNIIGNPDDPQCPRNNRPIYTGTDTSGILPPTALPPVGNYYTVFRMDTPAAVDLARCTRPTCADPRRQAPFEVGDYVTFAGTLVHDNGGDFISAHTITANLGIYTQPGVDPAFVTVNVSLIGTGGTTALGLLEATARTRFEGMTTDETRAIRVYGVDVNPATGETSDREWGSVMPDPGPTVGAFRGRWRLLPPCRATSPTFRTCVPPLDGQYIPPTREVRAVIDGLSQFLPGTLVPNLASQVPGTPHATTSANGLYYGQYHAPINDYLFPESLPGTPVPESNFNTMPFLAYGGYQSSTGTRAGILNPWPSNVPAPAAVCADASIPGGPFTTDGGGTLLSGNVTPRASAPVRVQWTAGTTQDGTDLDGSLTGDTTTNAIFNAFGLDPGTYFLTFRASNPCGLSTARTTITVQASPPPTIDPIPDQTVTPGLVSIQASSNSVPAPTWTWAQTAGPTLNLVPVPAPTVATLNSSLNFTATSVGTYTFTVTAHSANGTSPPRTVNVVVEPSQPINVTLNNSYRTGKQRLVITATTTASGVASMVLRPYLTETGTTFDPASLGAANLTVTAAAGTYTLTAVGAPRPACNLGGLYATPCAQTPLVVKALNATKQIIGTSKPSPLNSIRL